MMTVAASAAAQAARASESEAGLDIDGSSLISCREGDREGVGPLQVGQRQTAPECGVPGIGALTLEKHAPSIGQAEDAELGGQDQLESRQGQTQLCRSIGRGVARVAIYPAEPD